MKLNPNIAELCGIIMGDGHLHKTANRIVISGSLEDKYYYEAIVIPLFREIFGIIPKLVKRKNKNSYDLILENKKAFNLVLTFGLKRGNKNKTRIPTKIRNDLNLIPHFLRGLFDTDGYLKFSKQNKAYNYYPRIRLCFKISPLLYDLGILLDKLKFKYSKYKNNPHDTITYEISGKENLNKWMEIIGMNNKVHKSKYIYWKIFQKHIPNSSLKQRINSINLKKQTKF